MCVKKTGLSTSGSELDTPYVNVALLNARSQCNKALQINEYFVEYKWDALAITEMWLKKTGDEAVIADVTPPGYLFQHVVRSLRRGGGGGGVVLLHCDTFTTTILPSLHLNTVEHLRVQSSIAHSISFIMCVIHVHFDDETKSELLHNLLESFIYYNTFIH